MYSTPVQNILQHLDNVKVRSFIPDIPGTPAAQAWTACCPAHHDEHPSLSVIERIDGSVTLRCWTGCSLDEVLGALGLERRHLFPGNGDTCQKIATRLSVKEIAKALRAVAVGASMAARGELTRHQLKELASLAIEIADYVESPPSFPSSGIPTLGRKA